jgi:hypothetical protein
LIAGISRPTGAELAGRPLVPGLMAWADCGRLWSGAVPASGARRAGALCAGAEPAGAEWDRDALARADLEEAELAWSEPAGTLRAAAHAGGAGGGAQRSVLWPTKAITIPARIIANAAKPSQEIRRTVSLIPGGRLRYAGRRGRDGFSRPARYPRRGRDGFSRPARYPRRARREHERASRYGWPPP